ncbi:MAG: hypothetical protein EBU30_10260 [Synechococcaceae bacterium WB6_3B_236]|nr:hypothetical protein [Synechococcaceae bacterium WB6_3B_236]
MLGRLLSQTRSTPPTWCWPWLALVALALQLLALVPYGIVRTVLVAGSRGLNGTVTGLGLAAGVLLIIYWARALARPQPTP